MVLLLEPVLVAFSHQLCKHVVEDELQIPLKEMASVGLTVLLFEIVSVSFSQQYCKRVEEEL